MFKCQRRVHWLSASVWFLQVMLWFFSRHINPTQFCCEQLNGLKQQRQIGLNKWHVSVMWLFFTFLGGCLRTVCWLEACGETTTWKWAEYKHMQAPAQMFSCSEQSLDKVGIIVGWAFRISFFSWPADCYHGRLQDHPPPSPKSAFTPAASVETDSWCHDENSGARPLNHLQDWRHIDSQWLLLWPNLLGSL